MQYLPKGINFKAKWQELIKPVWFLSKFVSGKHLKGWEINEDGRECLFVFSSFYLVEFLHTWVKGVGKNNMCFVVARFCFCFVLICFVLDLFCLGFFFFFNSQIEYKPEKLLTLNIGSRMGMTKVTIVIFLSVNFRHQRNFQHSRRAQIHFQTKVGRQFFAHFIWVAQVGWKSISKYHFHNLVV